MTLKRRAGFVLLQPNNKNKKNEAVLCCSPNVKEKGKKDDKSQKNLEGLNF
jgi:hypothetical protein